MLKKVSIFLIMSLSLSVHAASLRCTIERTDYYGQMEVPMSQTFDLKSCKTVSLPSTDIAKEYYQYKICKKGYWITGKKINIKAYSNQFSFFPNNGDTLLGHEYISEIIYTLDEIKEKKQRLLNNTTLICK